MYLLDVRKEEEMKRLDRREFFGLFIAGAAAFVGVTAASGAQRTLCGTALFHSDTQSAIGAAAITLCLHKALHNTKTSGR